MKNAMKGSRRRHDQYRYAKDIMMRVICWPRRFVSERRGEWRKNLGTKDRWNVGVTVLIFLVTVGYTVFAALQWQATKEAAKAAATANEVAQRAIEISQRNVQQSERPWLLFDPTPPHPAINGNQATETFISLFVTNFGKSTAFQVRWALWAPPNPLPPIPTNMVLPRSHWSARAGHAILAPGATLNMRSSWKGLNTHPPPRLDAGNSVHIFALIKYTDMFQRAHRTRVCVEGNVSGTKNELGNCYSHNIAD